MSKYKSVKEACEARAISHRGDTGEMVRELLLNTDLTQAQIARKLGISQPSVSGHIKRLLKEEEKSGPPK